MQLPTYVLIIRECHLNKQQTMLSVHSDSSESCTSDSEGVSCESMVDNSDRSLCGGP